MAMSGRRGSAVLVGFVVLLAMTIVPGSASGEQTPDADFPNLPLRQYYSVDLPVPGIASSYTTNTAYVAPSKQWIQAVDLKVAADVVAQQLPLFAARCERLFGIGSPRCEVNRPDIHPTKLVVSALAYPTNFKGGDPASPPASRDELRRFGAEFTHFPSQRIRMVGFGALPTEVTMHLRLPTDSEGLPIGIRADADQHNAGSAVGQERHLSDTVAKGRLVVRLSDAEVDGRPVELGPHCEAEAPLSLEGRGFDLRTAPAGTVPEGRYNPSLGGILQGTLSVGAFSGCGVAGEDLSPLINAMAGGSDVPLRVVQPVVTPNCFGDNLRRELSESECRRAIDQTVPSGESLPALPPPYMDPPFTD